MRRFTEAGRRDIVNKNWYSALTLALTLPDVCASLADPGQGKSRARYISWCRKWLEPRYTTPGSLTAQPKVLFTAEDMYQARCSVIHSGTAEIEEHKRNEIDRFEFFSDGPHCSLITGNYYNGVLQPSFLQLRVDRFCDDVFNATEEWDDATINDADISAAKVKLLVIHEPGVIFGGIQLG